MMCIFVFVIAVDIISAIEFDKSGDHLATGDRGGRVVLFERTDTKEVGFFCLLLEFLYTKIDCFDDHVLLCALCSLAGW